MAKKDKILIIGAGLCGSLLALRLGQRGYEVNVIEKLPDLRNVDISAGRSINLAISDRGIKAMRMVGIEDKIAPLCIPMYGRMVHKKERTTFLTNYSGRDHEHINSISRGQLTALLMDEAEALDNVSFEFNKKCLSVDFENNKAIFKDYYTNKEISREADLIFGTDGVGSALRKSYYLGKKFLFSYSQNFLTHGYKELSIPPTKDGGFKTFKNALHIWPRGDYMLIALPNLDGSFTVTLFLSFDGGKYNFNNLANPKIVKEFFKKEFPDTIEMMPDLTEEFFKNKTSPLGTVKCTPWHYKGNTLLMGDSAHAIVPFYGQGMNASFEDVVEFDVFLENHQGDWETTFKAYEESRKKDTDAIADLAIDNFFEMKEHVNSPIFREKRILELALEKNFPDEYSSKYSLVTFNEDIGYYEAMIRGRAQDKAILNMITDNDITTSHNLTKEKLNLILQKIIRETNEIMEEDKVAGLK